LFVLRILLPDMMLCDFLLVMQLFLAHSIHLKYSSV